MKHNERIKIISTVLGLAIAACACFAAWLVVPQIQDMLSGRPILTPTPSNTPYAISFTPSATSFSNSTPTKENSPTPASTLLPTNPPTATPIPPSPTPALQLPFSDNFDKGIKSEWSVIQGQPLVVDGRLSSVGSSDDKAVLEIGDSFTDYVVEFDFEILPNAHYVGFIIGRRIRFTGNEYCCGKWESFSDGRWNYMLDGSRDGFGRKGHARVLVSGSNYSLSINGQPISEVTYGTPGSGPFAIIVDYRAFIDNFSITLR